MIEPSQTSTWKHKHSQEQTNMPSAGFETAIPTIERQQTHALDRTATGIDIAVFWFVEYLPAGGGKKWKLIDNLL